MSLAKAIEHGKEKRKPYYGPKAVDPHCRDGRCDACQMAKKYKDMKRQPMKDER